MLDSEVMSERTLSTRLESGDNEVCPSMYESVANNQSSLHEREPLANSTLKDKEMAQGEGPFLIRMGIQAS